MPATKIEFISEAAEKALDEADKRAEAANVRLRSANVRLRSARGAIENLQFERGYN